MGAGSTDSDTGGFFRVPQWVSDLSPRVLETYARLWQLETWLRRLVYVERSRIADLRLVHMPTPETDPLSYAQLSDVQRIIEGEWRLFEPFLPPQRLWSAKLEEVTQIRHRVAHFRHGHRDDLQRVEHLLRDVDHGFWHFCTSFNDASPVLPQSDDPVVSAFLHLDLIPWTEVSNGKWARIGIADHGAPLFVSVEVSSCPWAEWRTASAAGQIGLLYYVTLHARADRYLDYTQLLRQTAPVHRHLVYVGLDELPKEARVTIPAVLGECRVIEIIERFVEACGYAITRCPSPAGEDAARAAQHHFPALVVGPDNPLSFLRRDMPCSFFAV